MVITAKFLVASPVKEVETLQFFDLAMGIPLWGALFTILKFILKFIYLFIHKRNTLFSIHNTENMDPALKTMIENMPEKTGKSLQEWKKILKTKNFEKHGEAMKFLKGEHGVTHGFANMIVLLSKDEKVDDLDLVTDQYKGKESLKPIYDKLIDIVKTFGNDITITPKKTSVSLIRNKQFALIKPATKTRIDLGLKIKDQEPSGILENSGPFGTMCTHRIKLSSIDNVNEELINWLKTAYTKNF